MLPFFKKNSLIIILTRKCNLKCKHCFVEKNHRTIKKDLAFRAIRLFLSLDGEEKKIKFFGGEPFLEYKLLRELIKEVIRNKNKYSKDVTISVSTNGILVTPKMLKFLSDNNVEVSLNIDAFKSIFKDWRFKLRQFLKYDNLILNWLISAESVKNLCHDFLEVSALGAKKINLLPAFYVNWTKSQITQLKTQLNLISRFYLDNRNLEFVNLDKRESFALFNSAFVLDCDGYVYCNDIVLVCKDLKEKITLGNIKNVNFTFQAYKLKNVPTLEDYILKREFISTKKVDTVLTGFVNDISAADFQKRADIKIGFKCNNKCLFCAQGKKRSICAEKSLGKIESELIDAKKSCQDVVFTGGEPTIHNNFTELVETAKNLGYKRIQIQSNGRMFAYKNFAAEAINAGANEFAVAVHGHISSLHDYLTQGNGSFAQVIQGIENLKSLKQRVITNTVITKSNYMFLPKIAKLLVNLGVDQYQLAFVHPVGSAFDNFYSIVPRFRIAESFIKKGLDVGIKYGVKNMTEAVPYCLCQVMRNLWLRNMFPVRKFMI